MPQLRIVSVVLVLGIASVCGAAARPAAASAAVTLGAQRPAPAWVSFRRRNVPQRGEHLALIPLARYDLHCGSSAKSSLLAVRIHHTCDHRREAILHRPAPIL